jgi:DNA primase
MAMLQHPTLVGSELVERAARSAFSNQPLAGVRDAIAASLDSIESPDWLGRVTAAAPESLARLIEELGVAPIPHSGAESLGGYTQRVVGGLVDRDLLRRKEDLVSRLQRTQPTEDPDRFRTLQRALVALESERRALRERLTPSA